MRCFCIHFVRQELPSFCQTPTCNRKLQTLDPKQSGAAAVLPNIGTPLATQRLQACHVLLAQPRVQVWGLGFRVWSEGFRVWGLGFRVWSEDFGVWGLGA